MPGFDSDHMRPSMRHLERPWEDNPLMRVFTSLILLHFNYCGVMFFIVYIVYNYSHKNKIFMLLLYIPFL